MPSPSRRVEWVPPPGWPAAPSGWSPWPGWLPDPSWPDPPADWQWWRPREPKRAERLSELARWCAAVLVVCLAGGIYLHGAGVSASPSGWVFLALVLALFLVAFVTGIRQWGTRWWTTPLYAAAFAFLAGWSLVALVGPGSGAPGACSPGEACDLDQGLGLLTGPMMFVLLLVAAMSIGRGLATLVQHLRERRAA